MNETSAISRKTASGASLVDPVTYEYLFALPDGKVERFVIELDPLTLVLQNVPTAAPPAWTRLDFHQCPNCPLNMAESPRCPAALCLVPVVHKFEGLVSHDPVRVTIVTAERQSVQETTAQRAIGSMVGLLLATSGCPRVAFFKPMARFHLPLASETETVYRAASMYLLAQYFLRKDGREADFEMSGLTVIYRSIQTVNAAIADRLRAATETDSSVNAIILLDMYAKAMPYAIREALEELRYLFVQYFEEM